MRGYTRKIVIATLLMFLGQSTWATVGLLPARSAPEHSAAAVSVSPNPHGAMHHHGAPADPAPAASRDPDCKAHAHCACCAGGCASALDHAWSFRRASVFTAVFAAVSSSHLAVPAHSLYRPPIAL